VVVLIGNVRINFGVILHFVLSFSYLTDNRKCRHLKMIGKGFVLFKINSSPTAFYIIKPTCISWLVF